MIKHLLFGLVVSARAGALLILAYHTRYRLGLFNVDNSTHNLIIVATLAATTCIYYGYTLSTIIEYLDHLSNRE